MQMYRFYPPAVEGENGASALFSQIIYVLQDG